MEKDVHQPQTNVPLRYLRGDEPVRPSCSGKPDGEQSPSYETLVAIARALGRPVGEVLALE